MHQALRETIRYHVSRGFELDTLTPDNRATLVRDGEVLRLRMEGAAVFLRHEVQAPPQGRSWLAIALLALALIVALVLLIFVVLPQLRGQPDVDPEPVATSATAPGVTAVATISPAATTPAATAVAVTATITTATAVGVTATAPPDAGAATPAVPPSALSLVVSDQRFAPGETTVSIGGAGYSKPFFVVAHEGGADGFGRDIAHSDLLSAGAHEGIEVMLPRPLRDGEYVWLMLHRDENGNGVYDGADVDGAITDATAGNASFADLMVTRIQVKQSAPTPPNSGSGGLRAAPER